MRAARALLRLQLVQLRSAMAYRADFWIGVVGAVLQQVVSITFLVTFFGHVDQLGGWTIGEVAILHGIVMVAAGLGELIGDGVWRLRANVSDGSFDRLLVRPVSPAVQQMGELSSIHGTGNAGLGIAVMAWGLTHSQIEWQWWTIPVLALACVCGFVNNTALNFLSNMTAFWEPATQSAFPTMVALVRDFAKFPLDIYPQVLRVVVTFVLPYAAITFLPTSVVLGKAGAHGWWALTPVLAAGATAAVAAAVWRVGLTKYQGAGH
ncbi:ABC transporter permease [Aestuariimicrobium soli]|uniref:ABC transporter permease n=1 Tax=Aestuariimicrobium soli TaxID=2035834 RepID=UPI003EB9B026